MGPTLLKADPSALGKGCQVPRRGREGEGGPSCSVPPSIRPRSATCELMHGVRHWKTDCSISCTKRHLRSEWG